MVGDAGADPLHEILLTHCTTLDVCDSSFPFSVLEDLLETQTVASCWHIFSWIEERTERLTTVRVYQVLYGILQ
jgi:hypothetical protein